MSKVKIKKTSDGNLDILTSELGGGVLINGEQVMRASEVSNPNLLINGDFKVNQRGETTYSTAGAYTVDRWKLVSGTVTVEDEGITLNGTITQTFEYAPTVDVVASVDTSSGDVAASYADGVFTITTSEDTLIKWAKLEVGTTATVFSPKTYAEELANCQRYYQRIGLRGGAVAASYANILFPILPINCTLRTTPTLSVTTTPSIRGQGSVSVGTISSISINDLDDNGIFLQVTLESSSMTKGYIYALANGKATLDAEIY